MAEQNTPGRLSYEGWLRAEIAKAEAAAEAMTRALAEYLSGGQSLVTPRTEAGNSEVSESFTRDVDESTNIK